MRKLVTLAVVILLSMGSRAHGGALPALNVTGIGGVAHDVASGWKKPTIFAAECVVGPHYAGLYIGGACTTQGSDGLGTGLVFASYVAQGYFHGWFRGMAVTVGQRRQSLVLGGPPGYFVLLGVSR